MRIHNLLTAGLLLGASTAFAQSSISVEEVKCLATGKNTVVHATATGQRAGETPRLYFRWKEHGNFYWVEMESENGGVGRFWGVPPKPEDRNEEVEYYATLVDVGGRETARSTSRRAPVEDDCRSPLKPVEAGVADNLMVGETAAVQEGKQVLGFLCDGIVTRVNAQGIRRADEACRACVVAWWKKGAVVVPIAGVTGIIVADDDGPEASPARPN